MESKRVKMDCREAGTDCTLKISGTEEEVKKVGLRHAVEDHGYADNEELRGKFASMIKPDEEYAFAGTAGQSQGGETGKPGFEKGGRASA